MEGTINYQALSPQGGIHLSKAQWDLHKKSHQWALPQKHLSLNMYAQ